MGPNGKLEVTKGPSYKKRQSAHELSLPSFVTPGSNAPNGRRSWNHAETLSPPPFGNSVSSIVYEVPSSGNSWKTISPTPPSPHTFNNYNAAPDVKIKVKSNIQRSINARKQSLKQRRSFSSSQDENNVPEHIRKHREREQRRLRALEEREYRSASLLQAVFLGWYVRTVKYPKLRKIYKKRRKVIRAVLTIQKTFRMHVERKRYRYVIARKRRQERTIKEIKRMQKKIERMPKKTKHDIHEKRKEYELMKKEMLKNARKQINEDNEKITRARDSGQDMIKYINEENDKVKELIKTIQKEQRVLDKQFEILTAKSEEIALNFRSLQKWVDKKNESVKKNEASDQKCRYRYLPKYREDLKLRNRYCISEFRVKELYKRQIEKIIKAVEAESTDPNLVKYVQKEMKALREMPENPLPEGLEHRLKKY